MGLKSLSRELFSQAWQDRLAPSAERGMAAQITLSKPNSLQRTYDPDTDTWTDHAVVLYTGKARVQPMRAATHREQPGNETQIISVLVSIPIAYASLNIRPGLVVRVTSAPLNPSLVTYSFTVNEILDSSNPLERTFMCLVDQETAV